MYIVYVYTYIRDIWHVYMWHVYRILYTWHMTCGSRVWRMASLQQLVTVDICTLVTPPHCTVYFTIFYMHTGYSTTLYTLLYSLPYTAYYILYTAHCTYIVHFSPHTAHTGPRWHLQHFSFSIPLRAPHSAFDGSDDGGLIALIAPQMHQLMIDTETQFEILNPFTWIHIITLTWNVQFFEEEESSCGRCHLRIPPFLGRGGKSREIQRKSAGTNSLIFSTGDCSLRGVWSRSASKWRNGSTQ